MSAALIQLARAQVVHARTRPVARRFAYPVFCLRLRIDQCAQFDGKASWLFGVNRRRPVAFHFADHGARTGGDLMDWLQSRLQTAGISMKVGAVWLQCFPRVFGYVFNPVSFWYVYDTDGVLRVLVAEVNNTFGERHQYVLRAADGGEIHAGQVLQSAKVFHVSPFCRTVGEYRYRVEERGNAHRVAIDYYDDPTLEQAVLHTSISCTSAPLTTGGLLRALAAMPFMTIGVMVRIHLQAMRLFLRRVPFHRKPAPPLSEVSYHRKGHDEL
ncbi:DUF1365 domain-containing protein [Achromobacter seleniivolatilans]|uniref:DUF1365 domain-containing protein n=1 Tax=Achromobacter seleniivolatilans TaxID=3047478 RepID=A0ABY9M0T0_9BURK|nr:DUF1365 domain-containing protein [Achromobacter sp. R39]WMD20310.1 DUF1365 domain-containing protein [Achromobacter sp. R39]